MKMLILKKFILVTIIILFVLLWITRIIPSGLCILTATMYISDKYPDRDFKYSFTEYSSAHGEYFVHFLDRDGEKIAIMTSPFRVSFDPLNLPN